MFSNFTKKYILSLGLLILLLLLAYNNFNSLIMQQLNDSKIINISGKQRMISQKIYNSVISFNLEKLSYNLNQMQLGHNYLTSLPMSGEIKEFYYNNPNTLDKSVKEFLSIGRKIDKDNKNSDEIKYIINNAENLLEKFDRITLLYQKESETRIVESEYFYKIILLLSLSVLFLTGFFIFKPANRQLNTNERIYKDLFELNKSIIFLVNPLNGNIINANQSALDFYGYEKEKFLTLNIVDINTLSMAKIEEKMNLAIKNKQAYFEFVHKLANDELKNVKVLSTPTTYKGEIVLYFTIIDITEELKAKNKVLSLEKEKEKQAKILQQQSKMAAMGEMIENIAHQWRQPLSLISTASTGIKFKKMMNVLEEDDIETNMDSINYAVQHLSQTIDDFRDFFKTSKEKENFLLKNTFEKTFKLVNTQLKKSNIQLQKDIKEITIFGYESELIQVFINILNNAADEFKRKEQKTKLIIIDTIIENNFLEIQIKDNAGGIPEDIIDEIFESHFTTKGNTTGTGVGLYMSKMIIEEHMKGKIVASNTNIEFDGIGYCGAMFTISLPLLIDKEELL